MGRPEADIDIDELYDLMESGASMKDTAEELGVSVPTLSSRIAKIQKEQGLILQYRALQNLQLTKLQAEILERITPDKIESAPLRDLVFAYKILKERELVEIGKPTELKGMMHYLLELERKEQAAEVPPDVSQEDVVEVEVTEDGEVLPKL